MIIKIIQNSIDKFQPDSIKTIVLDKVAGIKAVVGQLKGEAKTSTHCIAFYDDAKWTQETAAKWCADNLSNVKSFDLTNGLDAAALDYLASNEIEVKSVKIGYESSTFSILKTKGMDGSGEDNADDIHIGGYLSTFKNIDRQNDVVLPGAFDETIKEIKENGGTLPILLDHNYSTKSLMGSWTSFKVDATGLYVEGVICRTSLNEHDCKMIEKGHLKTSSMGGVFIYMPEKNKEGNFEIKKVALFEGSLVTIPANPKAKLEKKSILCESENGELVAQAKESPVPQTNAEKIAEVRKMLNQKGIY